MTYCGGCCVRAHPGLCCGLCPIACASVARKLPCCHLPNFHEVFLNGKEEADRFLVDAKAEYQRRKAIMKFQKV